MLAATIILITLALLLSLLAYLKGREYFLEGLRSFWKTLFQQLPLLLAAFALAGYLEILISRQLVESLLGYEAGIKGVALGSAVGILLAAGPYVAFPIIMALYGAGAGSATIVAMTTAYMLLGLSKLPYEIALLGGRFSLKRYLLSFLFPLLAGILALLLNI